MPDGGKPSEKSKLSELASQLSESLNKAEPRTRRRKPAADDPPQSPPPPRTPPDDDGGGEGEDGGSYFGWPDNCPVTPLGVDGKEFLFMDANRQYVKLHHRDFGGHGLSALYGDKQLYLDSAWPRTNAKGQVLGLDKDRAARSHIAACSRQGVFDSDNKIRGVGAWTDPAGRLIWHHGDAVLVVDDDGRLAWWPIGPVGDHVYPQGVPQVRPALGSRDIRATVDRFYALLQTWHWKRGELDARLQLGWIGCALIGGALKWRPAEWATGGQGTGKSTLHDYVLNPVLGGTPSVVQTADATGAGLYQALQSRSTPVIFDELEPDPDMRARIDATIKLAKISSSGARIVRGSPEGTSKEFVARAAFLFSSILIPRLEPELAMRICILDLLALGDRKEPKIAVSDMTAAGAMLRALLVERWQHWPARLDRHRQALRDKGFSSRVADTWGSLLAMADHLLSAEASAEDAPSDSFDVWADQLRPWLDVLVDQAGSDHARLLQTLLTTTVDPFAKGQRWPLSTLLSIAAGRSVKGEDPSDNNPEMTHVRASSGLEALGVKYMLVRPPLPADAAEDAPEPDKIWALAVASNHTELNKLLRETKWGRGVYSQTLLRIPGAWSTQQRIARHKTQCAMIPIDLVLPPEPGAGGEGLFN